MTDSTGGTGPTATSDALAGTQWVIESIDGQPVGVEGPLPIQFGHDGRVSGSTGVNQLTASYTLTPQYVTIGPLATTRRAGSPEAMADEQRVIGSFAGICAYRLGPGSLSIDGPLGTVQLRSASAPVRTEGPVTQVAEGPPVASVRGTVRYREELPVPFGASVIVQVRVGSTVVGEEILTDVGEIPVDFVVDVHPYDPAAPHQAMAAITVGGEVRWRSVEPVPVLESGSVDPVDLLVAIPD